VNKFVIGIILFCLIVTPAWAVNWCDVFDFCTPMEDGSGSTVSNIGNGGGGDGTISGTVTWKTSSPPVSTSTYYLDFDGSNDIVSFSNPASFTLYDFSVGGWVDPDSTDSEGVFIISISSGYGYYLQQSSSGSGVFQFIIGRDGSYSTRSGTSVPTGSYQHVVGVRSDASGTSITTLYVDGVSESSSSSGKVGSIPLGSATTTMGYYTDTSRDYAGYEDEFFLEKSALDSTDIDDIMYNGLVQAAATATYSGRGIGRGISRGVFR